MWNVDYGCDIELLKLNSFIGNHGVGQRVVKITKRFCYVDYYSEYLDKVAKTVIDLKLKFIFPLIMKL